MLFFMIIRLRGVPFFVRIFPSDKNFATSLLFQTLLICSLRSYQQSHIIYATDVGEVDFGTVAEHFGVSEHVRLVKERLDKFQVIFVVDIFLAVDLMLGPDWN